MDSLIDYYNRVRIEKYLFSICNWKYFSDPVSVWWPVIFLCFSRASTQTCWVSDPLKMDHRFTQYGWYWYHYLQVSCNQVCSLISSQQISQFFANLQVGKLVRHQWSLWKILSEIFMKMIWSFVCLLSKGPNILYWFDTFCFITSYIMWDPIPDLKGAVMEIFYLVLSILTFQLSTRSY